MTPHAVVSFAVENDEAPDPVCVSLFRANAVMLAPNDIAHLIEQFWFVCDWKISYASGHEHDCV